MAAHIRRLEALRRAGIVERVADGLWKVPDDLPERGRQYDAQRLGGVAVEVKSHLSIERQARAIGATWLDQQLIGGGSGLCDLGFGAEAKQAMQQRADFLAEQGLAERRGQRVIFARNLLGTLRNQELAQAAKDISAETGLEHRPVADGQRVAGPPCKIHPRAKLTRDAPRERGISWTCRAGASCTSVAIRRNKRPLSPRRTMARSSHRML